MTHRSRCTDRSIRTSSEAILGLRISSGARLPSSRGLAADLGVSRNTVVSAFDQLLAEGYVDARTGAGTYVAFTLPDELWRGRPSRIEPASDGISRVTALSQRGALLARTPMSYTPEESKPRAFQVGVPAVDAFPFGTWRPDHIATLAPAPAAACSATETRPVTGHCGRRSPTTCVPRAPSDAGRSRS